MHIFKRNIYFYWKGRSTERRREIEKVLYLWSTPQTATTARAEPIQDTNWYTNRIPALAQGGLSN